MTPDERKEAVAMLRRDAAYEAERADGYNQHHQWTRWTLEQAWFGAARANLLTLAADELEKTDAR